ncbi:hypothetical protein M3Y99_01020900 [Aphelenchoides fujianensis]|nr:hypothetical protein M3Y99_01020900 [Aphelenchoides fujianensis]
MQSALLLLLLPLFAYAQTNETLYFDNEEDFALAQSVQHNIKIEGSSIDGDVIIDGNGGQDVTISGSRIRGNLYFSNGCAIYNDMVHECDHSSRRMNAMERTRLRKRVHALKRAKKVTKTGGKKKASHKKAAAKGKKPTRKNTRKNRKQVGKRNRMANAPRRRNNKRGRKTAHKKAKKHVRGAHLPGSFSPCHTCHGEQGGEHGGWY